MLTEEEMQDFNNAPQILTQMLKRTFDHWKIKLGDNIEDLDVGYRNLKSDDIDKNHHSWYVWVKVKEGPHESKEYGCSIDVLKSEFSKYKFKNKREVETAIAEGIKDYVYGS